MIKTTKEYELVYALLDDVVEENAVSEIKKLLDERDSVFSDGWVPATGITDKAKVWRDENQSKTIRIGNVNFTWANACRGFVVEKAS